MKIYRIARTRAVVVLLALGAAACGGSDPTGVEPDPAVEPFVGTWEASTFEITSAADPTLMYDILEGGAFTINVQPSGQYTATLEYPGFLAPVTEFGRMTVGATTLTLDPSTGPPVTSSYVFDGPDRVTLEGPTEFDFNRDGVAEEGEALIVLERS